MLRIYQVRRTNSKLSKVGGNFGVYSPLEGSVSRSPWKWPRSEIAEQDGSKVNMWRTLLLLCLLLYKPRNQDFVQEKPRSPEASNGEPALEQRCLTLRPGRSLHPRHTSTCLLRETQTAFISLAHSCQDPNNARNDSKGNSFVGSPAERQKETWKRIKFFLGYCSQ